MTSQTGQQIIIMHILSNISRSKGNQTMRFGQFVENMRNVFFEKSHTHCGREASPRPSFIKNQN